MIINIYRIALVCFLMSCQTDHLSGNQTLETPTLNSLSEGDDWFLPSSVNKLTNSGLYDYPGNVQHPDAVAVNTSWKLLNPNDGVYDWSIFEQASASGQPIWVRIFASDARHIPEWIKSKYPNIHPLQYAAEGGSYSETLGGVSPGLFYPIWKSEIEQEFSKFMSAFKQRKYYANPNFKFMYAPGAWRWNEWEVVFTAEARKDLGSAEKYFTWFKNHIDIYCNTFQGFEYKLVYTGYPQMDKCEEQMDFAFQLNDVRTGNNLLTDYAISKGMSVRVGAMEYYNGYSHTPSWGSGAITTSGKRYQGVDYHHPLHADQNHILGTENEGFGDDNMFAETDNYFFVKMATLKALYMGLNWLNMSDRCYQLAPDVIEYARKTMGKNPGQSPDAWVALRQWEDVTYKGIVGSASNGTDQFFAELNLPYRNWERFLIQRDVDGGGVTIPTQKLSGSSIFQKNNGDSFEAIRTDLVTGNKYIYFGLDDEFLFNVKRTIMIKVTYLDENTTTWRVEYDGGPGKTLAPTESVINSNDGHWKTKTFLVKEAVFANGQDALMDFRIANLGNSDLTIRFVRVIKYD